MFYRKYIWFTSTIFGGRGKERIGGFAEGMNR